MARRNPSARRALTEINDLEKRLTRALDNLPDTFLGLDPAVTEALRSLVEPLADVVQLMEHIARAEGDRYLRSGAAQTVTQAQWRRSAREYLSKLPIRPPPEQRA